MRKIIIYIIDKLIEWRMNKKILPVDSNELVWGLSEEKIIYNRVLNTLRKNKIMSSIRHDGIHIRLAGNENGSELNSSEWVRIVTFKTYIREQKLNKIINGKIKK